LRVRLKSAWIIAATGLLVAALLAGWYLFRHRFVRSDPDLFTLLPAGDATLCFVDVDKIRRAGMLNLFSGPQPELEGEYKIFIQQTGFNYARDIDAVVGWSDGEQILLVLRGRFDWTRLNQYASGHGGTCSGDLCRVPSGRPGKVLSFTSIQPDVLGLALSSDSSAAKILAPHGDRPPLAQRPDPAWMKLSRALLRDPTLLPLPLRIFAIAVQSADSVVLSLGPSAQGQDSLALRLEAGCPNVATAETIRNQLELQTRMLTLELTRERKEADRADLTGLLTAGAFQVVDRRVLGSWPLHEELLKSLQ
jgi:hypothetical protein